MIAQRTAYIQYHRLHSYHCDVGKKKEEETIQQVVLTVYVWIDAWCGRSHLAAAAAAKPLSMQFDMDLYPDRNKRQMDHSQ
jgi:hypothetical protein